MPRSDRRSDNRKTENKINKKGIIAGVILGVLLLGAGGYTVQSQTYKERFLPKTFIGDLDVSQLSVKEANEKLVQAQSDLSFVIEADGKEWKSFKKTELGLESNFETELEALQKKQNPWKWGVQYVAGPTNLKLAPSVFNEETLNEQTAKLEAELVAWNKERTQTKNATLERKESGFEIVPEVQGDNVDTKKVIEDLQNQLLNGASNIELTDFIVKPSVKSDDPKLTQELESINKIAQVEATYVINGNSFQIPSEKINEWIIYQDGKVSLNRELVHAYVTQLGVDYNTSTNPSTFVSTKRGEVSVPAGSLSWTIATETETDELIASILAGESFSRSPIAQGSANSGSPLFGNTYIEIDLINQHMWYYKDGQLLLDTPVVTGKPSTPTPAGVFYAWNKALDETLRGTNDDGSKYAEPVDYWVPIDWTGIGIHDSDWQPAYGGELWKTVGSHGCINTPPNVMKQLYGMIDVGVPVLVF